ncbi:MAG: endolytic transglycosylase MltG [Nitriliruptoraceae bacterium]
MRLSRGSRWFLGFGLILVAGVIAGVWYLDTTVLDDGVEAGQSVEYTVERGASVSRVGDDLADLGVVRSGFRFRSAAGEAGLADTLRPGVFELETGMEVDEVIRVLEAGPVAPPTIRFTVPEGLTVEQTLEELAEQFPAHEVEDFREVLDARRDVDLEDEEVSAEIALSGLLEVPAWVPEPSEVSADLEAFEGLLWPQTYEVLDTASAQEVLQRMIDQLDVELEAVPEDLREGVADEELYDTLIFASLIERETRVDEERPLVAGVIQNRIDEGMRLQIDATVVYALGGGPRDVVTFDDLEIEHPHNTYVIDGLPPTPISGVGTAAFQAALAPAETDFLFYVLDPACDGTHVFAEDLEEHNQNVEAFRDGNRCQDGELR